MLELELKDAEGVLEDFDPKEDKEGKFAYLTFSFGNIAAEALEYFDTGLPERMFKLETVEDLAGGEILRVRDTGEIYPQKRAESMSGALLKVEYGIGGPMDFPGTAIDGFEITPRDGGLVILSMRVKVRPDQGQAGRLYMLNKGPVKVNLEPGELLEMKAAA